jgi:hypothetical protein
MKSILKYLTKNRIALLSVFDIAIVIWIAWYERGIEYERLLDTQYAVLLDMGLPLVPLCEAIYNTMIVTIAINMIVLLLEILRKYKRKYEAHELAMVFVYFSLTMFFMLLGSFYISTRIYGNVISESNTLFRLPIWLFGKELFTSIFTAPGLYLSVCIVHLCLCLFYLYLYIVQEDHGDRSLIHRQ